VIASEPNVQSGPNFEMQIDESHWPVVVATCPTKFTLASVEEMARAFDRILGRREKFVLVVDATPLTSIPDARWRRALTEWMNDPDFRARHARYNLGSANVLPFAAPLRAVMTAITWLWNPPTPQHYPTDVPHAIDWAFERLRAAHVDIPDAVLAWREQYGSSARTSSRPR
jgi:hypothetical protein